MRKFGTVAKASNAVCHRETNSVSAYKKCMSTNMKAGLKKAGLKKAGVTRTAGKKSAKKITCKGLYKSGANKGKVKPGYKRSKTAGRCPVKKK